MLKKFTVLVLALLPAGYAFAATTYTLTDLGTLGGSSSFGTAINDNGNAVGYSTTSAGDTNAFYWTPSGMQNLGTAGVSSEANDLNNNEQVVGISGNKAFRWTSGTGLVLIDSANSGTAAGLNNSNVAVGIRFIGSSPRFVFWSSSNTITEPFPAAPLSGVAVNDLNQYTGTTTSGGFYYDGVSNASTFSIIPHDLNNSRQIVGSLGGVAELLDFDTSATTVIGKLSPTDATSDALGINQAGTVVGVSGSKGFIFNPNTAQLSSLTSLLDPSFSGWTILTATDINNNGQIIGQGEFDGVDHAVILTSVPEPSSWILGILGCLAGLILYKRCG